MTLLLNIYILGILCSIMWWMILSYFVFNKKYDENSNVSLVKSIQELRETIESSMPLLQLSMQSTYLVLSLLVTFAWPIFLILFLKKQILKN